MVMYGSYIIKNGNNIVNFLTKSRNHDNTSDENIYLFKIGN